MHNTVCICVQLTVCIFRDVHISHIYVEPMFVLYLKVGAPTRTII